MPQQGLPLDPPRIKPRPLLAAPSNSAAREWLARTADWPDHRLLLWGPPGCGKSLLATDWCAPALPLQATTPPLDILATRPARIAIDNADRIADEPALLHTLNACAEAAIPLLLTAAFPTAHWPITLPDLASRLRAMQSAAIAAPEDGLLEALFDRLLAERQLRATDPAREWLLRRIPRTAEAVRDAVARLDQASLARQLAITRALAIASLPEYAEEGTDQGLRP